MKWMGINVGPDWTRGGGKPPAGGSAWATAGGFFLLLAGLAVVGIAVAMFSTLPTVIGVGAIILGALFVVIGVRIMAANA